MFQEKKLSITQCQNEKKLTFYAYDKASEDLIDEYESTIIDQYERNKYFNDMNYEHNVSQKLKEYLSENHLKLCCIKNNNERILFVFNEKDESILLVCNSSKKLGTNPAHVRIKRQQLFEALLLTNNQINQRLINFVSDSNASFKQVKVTEEKTIIDESIENSLAKQKLSPTDVMLQEIAESLYQLTQDESETDHLNLIKNRCIKLIYKYHFIQLTVNKKELKLIIFKDQNNLSNKIYTLDVKHTNIEKYKEILQLVSNAIYVSPTDEGYMNGLLFFKTSFIENKIDKNVYTLELQSCDQQEQALCCDQLIENSTQYEIIYDFLIYLVDQTLKTQHVDIFIINLTLAIKNTEFIKPLIQKIFIINHDYSLFHQMYLNHSLQTYLSNYLLSAPDEKILHFIKSELSIKYNSLYRSIIEEKKQLIPLMLQNSAVFDLESLIMMFESNSPYVVKALFGIMIIQNDDSLKESTLDELKEIYPHIMNNKEFIDLISINNELKNIFSTFENDHREKTESQKLVIRTKTSQKKKSLPPRQVTKTLDDIIKSYGRWGPLASHILSMDSNDVHIQSPYIKTRYLIPYMTKNPIKKLMVGGLLFSDLNANIELIYNKLYDFQNENFFFKPFYKNFESDKLTIYEFIDIFAYIFNENSNFKQLKLHNLKFWETFFSKLLLLVPEEDKRKLILKFNDEEINFIREICKYNENLRNLYSELFSDKYDFSTIFMNELKLISLAFIPKDEFIQCYYFLSNIINNYIESDEYQQLTGDEFNQNDFYTKDLFDLDFNQNSSEIEKYSKHKLIMFFNSRFISNLIYPFSYINILEFDNHCKYLMSKSYILNIIWFGISRLNTDDQNNTLEIPFLNITFESDVIIPKDNAEKYISDLIRIMIGFCLLNLKINYEIIKYHYLSELKGLKALTMFKNYSYETKVIFEKALNYHDFFENIRQKCINETGKKIDIYSEASISSLYKEDNSIKKTNTQIDVNFLRDYKNKEERLHCIANTINFDYIVRKLMSIHPSKRKMLLFNVMNENKYYSTKSFASVFSDLEKKVQKNETEKYLDTNDKFFDCTIKKRGVSIIQNASILAKDRHIVVEEKTIGAVLNEHYPKFYSGRFF